MTATGTDTSTTRRPSGATRVIFIDLARALAVVFMLYGHTVDALLAPAYRSGRLFDVWQFQRGLTSGLFLLLSGFAFSIATTRHWASHLAPSPALLKRIRRFALFIFLGYAVRFPIPSLFGLGHATDAEWRQLIGVDVLQLIGVTFLAVQALVMISRSRRVFSILAVTLALVLTMLAPWAWSVEWSQRTPAWLAAYLSPSSGSLFPVVPWSAFVLAGAALGQIYARWGATHHVRYANRALLIPGVVLLIVALWMTQYQVALFGTTPHSYVPGNILLRAGACLVIVGLIAHASRGIGQLPHVFGAVAQESLLIYVLHLGIVYGSVWAPGLLNVYGVTRTPVQLIPIVLLLIVAMTLSAYGWNWLKHTHRTIAWWTMSAVVTGMIVRLL
jgi:uncharacterized membrane protein